MVRISILGMCVLLSLPVSGQTRSRQPAPSPLESTPVPRLVLKRESARIDAQGIRCTIGSAITIFGSEIPKTESFVEVAGTGTRMDTLPQGLYIGSMVWTTRGRRLLISRNVTPTDLARFHAYVSTNTADEIDAVIERAIAAPLIVDRPNKTTRELQIGIGKLDEEGCEVHNPPTTGADPVGMLLRLAISIEGEVPVPQPVPAPQPDRVSPQPSAPQPVAPQSPVVEPADPRERVVNIRNAKGQSIGAGVVLGKTANRLYIITAQHVVWTGEVKESGLTVSFFSLAGESFPVTVLDFSDDEVKGLDLAVLTIPTATAGLPEVGKLVVGNPRELVLGATVRSIGHPGGVLWKLAATPEKFSRRVSSDLEFESLIADSGSSGGGLFNACNALIGITKKAGSSTGLASPIDRVLDKLDEWNIKIASTMAPCGSE